MNEEEIRAALFRKHKEYCDRQIELIDAELRRINQYQRETRRIQYDIIGVTVLCLIFIVLIIWIAS